MYVRPLAARRTLLCQIPTYQLAYAVYDDGASLAHQYTGRVGQSSISSAYVSNTESLTSVSVTCINARLDSIDGWLHTWISVQ
jgi:hypothetical protein